MQTLIIITSQTLIICHVPGIYLFIYLPCARYLNALFHLIFRELLETDTIIIHII
jgi:hypothetical protein